MKIVYVAGKFRGVHAWAIAQNVRRAEELGFAVAAVGAMPLIPHANTAHFHGTFDDEFWLEGLLELLRRCDALITVPGWEGSAGACKEVEEARQLGIPIFHEMKGLRRWLGAES